MGARKGTTPCDSSAQGASLHIHHSGSAQPARVDASIPPLQQGCGCNAPGAPFWGCPFMSSSYQAWGTSWCIPTPTTTAEHAKKHSMGSHFWTHMYSLGQFVNRQKNPAGYSHFPALHGIADQLPIDPTFCQQSPREILQPLPAGPGTTSNEAEPTQPLEKPPAPTGHCLGGTRTKGQGDEEAISGCFGQVLPSHRHP